MTEYFPEPKSLGLKVEIELDLSNYATKSDLKTSLIHRNLVKMLI